MKKLQSFTENILLPLLLVVYALFLVNQGITVTDTGYNYGNFINYDSLDGMWKFSTYLATALGALFTRLPYGRIMLGMNVYTGLVKVLIALIVYFVCVKVFRMKKSLAFTAELVALGYCWCPTALLYNYCTYLFFNLGAILLCIAVKKEKNYFYILAGVCLGLNVLVRLPNLAEMALIAALWFYCIIRKEKFGDTLKRTALCVAGYGLGIGGVLAYISARYGFGAYLKGIRELLEMPGEAGGYSLKNMILGDIDIYIYNMRWLLPALGFVVAGMALYAVCRGRHLPGKRVFYLVCNVLLIFVYRWLGLFKFVYTTYEGVYSVGSYFLIISGLLGLYVMFFGGEDYELRMHAAVMGIIILITPLGSNNYLFTAVNNLFWVMPFVLRCCQKIVTNGREAFDKRGILSTEPLKITLVFLVGFVCVQGVLFGSVFVFRDGMGEAKRDVMITDIEVLKGMYTTAENAEALNSLHAYLDQEELKGREVILYQDIPAIAYYMDLKPAISSTWPDLVSYSVEKFRQELERVKESYSKEDKPLLILGCLPEEEGVKMDLLREFMDELDYEMSFSNDKWFLYR
ncbi:MAG: hypothetical protein ACI4HQ_06895 [Acetatifactor sp.]